MKTRDNNFTFFNGEFRITNFPVDVNDINLEILGLSIRPFFGLKYFITNQLSISFEPTFNISYSFRSHMINEDVINALELDSNIDPVTGSFNGLVLDFDAIRFINLGYLF